MAQDTITTRYRQTEAATELVLAEIDHGLAYFCRWNAAKLVKRSYPHACYIGHEEAFAIIAPIAQPQIVICLPGGYAIHNTLCGKIGSHIETIRFQVQL